MNTDPRILLILLAISGATWLGERACTGIRNLDGDAMHRVTGTHHKGTKAKKTKTTRKAGDAN